MIVVSPVIWMYEDSRGNRDSIEIPGPGGEIRVAVGEPGRRSGTWKIWATRTKPDVYIANRDIARYQKWSLHKSGEWQFQWISRHQAWEFAARDDRLIRKWSPPPELGPTGWTKGIIIRFPYQDIVPINDTALPDDIAWLPAPEENYMINVFVIVARTNQPPITLQGLILFEGFTLSDGRVVLLFAARESLTDEQIRQLADLQGYGLEKLQGVDIEDEGVVRMLAMSSMPDGTPSVWEIPVNLPHV